MRASLLHAVCEFFCAALIVGEDIGDVGGLRSREVPSEGSEATFHKVQIYTPYVLDSHNVISDRYDTL